MMGRTDMSKRILVYGAGGFAREVKDVLDAMEEAGKTVRCIGFLDDEVKNHGRTLNDVPVHGGEDRIREFVDQVEFLIGIGNPVVKKKIAEKIAGHGGRFAKAFHPAAVTSRYVEYGEGTIVTAGVILTNQIRIGKYVILNLGVTVGHDCVLEDYVTVAPGVFISGNVRIGEGTDVGTGSSIIQGVKIGRWSVIGAGAVVTKDIPDNCTAVGVPAKVIKTREEGWYLA
jgi:sugar O-acyltransferase (sialic acid O-acetyltransferase NeuD family)